jgi:hypothetical protein
MRKRRYVRYSILALALVAVAWFLPSFLRAERYRRRLQASLEQALGRPLVFGAISPQLLPRPGFSIQNATIGEAAGFGSEPFARIDRVDCNLALASLLRGRAQFSHLVLDGATINLVRNAQGQWNAEGLFAAAPSSGSQQRLVKALEIEVEDARLNFKFGADKKPFAITDLNGRVRFDRERGSLHFDLTGAPVRTDLHLPSPGKLEFVGDWLSRLGMLDARLRTRGALVYDWVPLLTGRNPEIYGVLDGEAHLTGSLQSVSVDAQARVTQLRRWESLPPSGDFPLTLSCKGGLDRTTGRATLERFEAAFGASDLAVAGTVAGLGRGATLDLTATIERSRLEDFLALAERLDGRSPAWGVAGRVDGLVAVEGPWPRPQYSGFVSTRDAKLTARAASFMTSDAILRFQGRRIQLEPIKITAAPRVAIVAEGALQLNSPFEPAAPAARSSPSRDPGHSRESGNPPRDKLAESKLQPSGPPEPNQFPTGARFLLQFSTRSAPLHEIVSFARDLGVSAAENLEAQGSLSAELTLSGAPWPLQRPAVSGRAQLHATRLWFPGLTEAVDIEDARLELNGDQVIADPITATLGSSVFSGRIVHSGAHAQPWSFDLRSPALDVAQTSSWFETLSPGASLPWFARIPGLSTFAARRAAGSNLLSALNAEGNWSTPSLTYRAVSLRNFRVRVAISRRVLRLSSASFRVAGGRGAGLAEVDLTRPLPRLTAEFSVTGMPVATWAPYLPPQLAELRGLANLTGTFSADGSSRPQLASSLEGSAHLRLANLALGRFDPLQDAARSASWGDLAPSRSPLTLRSAELTLEVHNRQVILKPWRVVLGGAVFKLAGSCGFDHAAAFEATADLRAITRRWNEDSDPDSGHLARFRLAGKFPNLAAVAEDQVSRATR